jgi:predicted kinase
MRPSTGAPTGSVFGSPGDTLDLALDNFTGIRPLLDDPAARDVAAQLRHWTLAEHAVCSELMSARQRDGFVRECHGDLHLGNVVYLDGRITPIDCLEFSARLRWCDVMSEIAFTTMDLRARGHSDLARRFLNAYLEVTGDYAGLPLLRFHVVYRALVRAKVACLRAAQTHDDGVDARREGRSYLDLASKCATRRRPSIVVTHGLAASGKTTASQQLLERADFIRIRSDVERKRLQGLAAQVRTGSPVAAGIYASDTTHATYVRVRDLARTAVAAGQSVVIDATFLQRWQRQLFRELASSMRIPFAILSLSADESVLREP